MKAKFFIAVVLFAAVFSSCKGDKEAKPVTEEVKNNYKVTLNVIAKVDDNFSVFYTEDGSIDFTKIEPIFLDIKGSETEQAVVCNIPADVFPTQLRLDFGFKKEQPDVILKSVVLEYGKNKKEIVGADLSNFFRADENKCTFDATTGVIKALVKDGVKQYPSLYPQEANLGPVLEALAK